MVMGNPPKKRALRLGANKNLKYLQKIKEEDILIIWDILNDVVLDLENKGLYYWTNVYTLDYLKSQFNNLYKIVLAGEIIGAAIISNDIPVYYIERFKGDYLKMFYVHPKHRNKITFSVFREICNIVGDTLIFDCSITNTKLNNFYKWLGAVEIGKCSIDMYSGTIYRVNI